jgi:hypothetical protein
LLAAATSLDEFLGQAVERVAVGSSLKWRR